MIRFFKTSCLIAALLLILKPIAAFSAEGDTTHIRVFDKYLWTWYGSQDRMANFPAADKKFKKVLMRYTLTCPTGGCGEWDYTTNVYFRRPLGRIDSAQKEAVNFTADGKVVDSLSFSYTPTWKTRYSITKKATDSSMSTPITLYFFKNADNPSQATDSMTVYPVGYWNYYYNGGNSRKTDSVFVAADTTLRVVKTKYFEKFEVKEDIEMGRFITPYGKGFPQGWSYTWTFDVTDYQYLLHGLQEIRSRYDGYSQGSLYTLDFDFIEGTPERDIFNVEVLYSGAFPYGNPDNSIENYLPAKKVFIPASAGDTYLRLITTGHGFGGTDNAGEFAPKTHTVSINGTERFEQYLWREDCGQNPVFPQAGTWIYQRAGWCPGADVRPNDYLLTPFVQANDSATIDYNMQEYTNADLSHPATYIIQAQVFYSRNSLKNDAGITAIKAPNNAPEFRRMNPVATFEKPIISIKNIGRDALKTVTVNYGIDGDLSHTYTWNDGPSGGIAPLKTLDIFLPGIELGQGEHTFSATVSQPNGITDEYAANNAMTVRYTPAKIYTGNIILTLKNNSNPGNPNGTRYELYDMEGKILLSKSGLADNATIRDTFPLKDGSYIFTIYDDVFGSGLMFPFINGSTNGNFVLKDSKNVTIYSAQPGYSPTSSWFGDRQKVSFSVTNGAVSVNEELPKAASFTVFPNPSSGITIVRSPSEIRLLEIFAVSGILLKSFDPRSGNSAFIDLSEFSAGYYVLRCTTSGGITTLPLVKAE